MDDRLQAYAEENAHQTVALEDGFTLERYAQFARWLPSPGARVLDVGCAAGRGGARLKELAPGIELVGLDCVEDRLKQLPPAYASGIHGLTNRIPAPDLGFDAIVAGEFLEHLYPADVDVTLCEFQRVLKIGGRLMLTTPNPNSLKLRLRKGSVFGTAHFTQHFPDVLRLRLRMHGFSRVRLLGSGKAIRYFGCHFPWLSLYGSFLALADKI